MSIFEKYDLLDVDESFPIPELPDEGLILITGTSGSGKTSILRQHFDEVINTWDDQPLYMNFSSPENAEKYLLACGLRTIPAWKRPYRQLSNGEKHRADCAMLLDKGCEYIDEFTSVVDRNTARALASTLHKHFNASDSKRLVIATCHKDVTDWLKPDHVYDTDMKLWLDGDYLCPTSIKLHVEACDGEKVWPIFQKHHYLDRNYNKSASAFVGYIEHKPITFCSVLAFPSGTVKNAWREHRTVVLPEFQGLGIGNRMSEEVAEYIVSEGCRFFSKTAHPAMGEHRNKSSKWKPTSKNGLKRKDYKKHERFKNQLAHTERVCYSHEYVGETYLEEF